MYNAKNANTAINTPPTFWYFWKKFAKENALLSQLFVIDNKTPISEVVAQAGKAAGKDIKLVDYVRYQLGEGIEKEVSDFAAEVAAAVGA